MERSSCSRRQLALSATTVLLHLFLATSLLPLASAQYSNIPEQLSRIFASTSEVEWRDKTNWHTDAPYCTWYKIYCYKNEDYARFGKIGMINLSDNQLVGTILQNIWRLNDLEVLELRNNPFFTIESTGIGGSLEHLVVSNTGNNFFMDLMVHII